MGRASRWVVGAAWRAGLVLRLAGWAGLMVVCGWLAASIIGRIVGVVSCGRLGGRSLAAILASSSTCPLFLGRWCTAITIPGLLIAVPVIGVGDILQGLRGTLCRIVFGCGQVSLARWSFGSWVQYCINVPTRLTLVDQRELISRMNSV